jgi:hypothetical protein
MLEHDGIGWRNHVDTADEVDSDRLQPTDLSGQSGMGIEKGAFDGCCQLRPDGYFGEVDFSHDHYIIGTDEQLARQKECVAGGITRIDCNGSLGDLNAVPSDGCGRVCGIGRARSRVGASLSDQRRAGRGHQGKKDERGRPEKLHSVRKGNDEMA